MESSDKASRLIGKLLLILLLLITGWAAYTQFDSPFVQILSAKDNQAVYLAILTKPAMIASYNPHTHKAVLTQIPRKKTEKNLKTDAQNLFQTAGISPRPLRYYMPRDIKRDEYWLQFREDLTNWRTKPYLAGRILFDYLQALHDKRTNLKPSEFFLLALDGSRLELTDFTLINTKEDKKKKGQTPKISEVAPDSILPPVEDRAPLAMEDRPLVLEVLNASGVKGAALDLTQYLRDQAQKGLLHVDVLNYDNYPGERQKQTRIIDFTGRRAHLKQLSTAIGVNNEIVSEKQDTAMFDARIIIGEDFKQPL